MELKQIKELIKILDDSDINKLKIKDKEFFISLSKERTVQATSNVAPIQTVITEQSSTTTATSTASSCDNNDSIKSPMVGTFYEAPSPKSPTFVKVGDTIKKGDPIGIIEAMKIMNEIEADFDCKVIKVLVKNEQPVEFDMPLYIVEKL
jgi:acetyl-CoA carboxylase biotin carboxyl carrier protein